MKKLLLTFAVVVLAGCGYTPMYANVGDTRLNIQVASVQMRDMETNVGERRAAQAVRQQLERTFVAQNGAAYQLRVVLEEDLASLAVRDDATDLRLQLRLRADVELHDGEGNLVTGFGTSTSASFNVEDSPYSTDAGKLRARSNAAEALSEEIIHRVMLYFARDERQHQE